MDQRQANQQARDFMTIILNAKYYINGIIEKHNPDRIIDHINKIADELSCENHDLQDYVIKSLINNYLHLKSLSIRQEIENYAKSLGIFIKEKVSVKTPTVHFEIKYVDYNDAEINKILSEMNAVDWSYSEQYADILTRADKDNIYQRNVVSNKINMATIESLRKMWSLCNNEKHKKIISKIGIFKGKTK